MLIKLFILYAYFFNIGILLNNSHINNGNIIPDSTDTTHIPESSVFRFGNSFSLSIDSSVNLRYTQAIGLKHRKWKVRMYRVLSPI